MRVTSTACFPKSVVWQADPSVAFATRPSSRPSAKPLAALWGNVIARWAAGQLTELRVPPEFTLDYALLIVHLRRSAAETNI